MIVDRVSDINIDNVFLRLNDFIADVDLYVKIESLNLANSIKLKAASAMIRALEESGKLRRNAQVVESSSGNLGVALAMICAERGYRFTCVTDPNVSPQNLAAMRAYGANVVVISQAASGSYVRERLRVIRELLEKHTDMVWTDQYSNPENPRIHAELTAPAILREVPNVTHLFLGVGSSGTYSGCFKYFKTHKPDLRVIAADPDGSVLFGGASKPRFIPGIGGSVCPELFDPTLAHDYVVVSEAATLRMCNEMARTRGWMVGGSTGTVLTAVSQYAHKLPVGSTVVAIAPDFGSNYLDTVYNDDWAASVLDRHEVASREVASA